MTVLHSHRFTTSTIGSAFAGDTVYSNLAGTVPTVVDAADQEKGLRFAAGAQGLVAATITSTTGRLLYDVVIDFAQVSTGTTEIVQFRGAAKVASLNRTSSGKLALQNAAGTVDTLVPNLPATGTKFRVLLDANNGSGDYVATVYATDDAGASVLGTLTVTQAATAITSVRLGYSGTSGTGTFTASWPILATDPSETGARTYDPTPPPPATYLLDHSFTGTTSAVFNGDAKYSHIAGSKPTYVRTPVTKGLRFDGAGQSIIEHVYGSSAAGSLVVDRVYRLTAPVTGTTEVLQVRAGTSRGPAVALVDVSGVTQVRLLRLSSGSGVSADTSAIAGGVPTNLTRFRVQFVVNGVNLTVRVYLDDTTTTPAATLTSSTSTAVTPTAVRDGIITATGMGSADLDVIYPQDATELVPGPRTYPALPVEAPQAIAAQPAAVEPWGAGALVGTAIEETSPVVSLAWSLGSGNTAVLTSGAGGTRAFAAPASLDATTLPFVLTATDSAGRTGTATVQVPLLPATWAVRVAGALVPLDLRVFGQDYQPGTQTPDPAPQIIVVSNFQPLDPTTTGRTFTFQTNDGVEVTRVMEYRVVGASTWTTHSVATRTGSHTAGFTGLTPGVSYETRMTFSADRHTSKVITSADYSPLNFTTPTTPPPASGDPKLTWAPPTLVDPIVWTVSAANRTINVPSDRDLRIVMPSTPFEVKGGLELVGARNVVCIGGEYKVDTPFYLPEYNGGTQAEAAITNRFLKFRGRTSTVPRTIHLEGLKVHGAELFEGMNWQAFGDDRVTIVQQNVWVGPVRAFVPNPVNGGSHDGGDWWQPIEGPWRDRIDRVWLSDLRYQGLWLQPIQFGAEKNPDVWDYRNLQVTGVGPHAQIFAMNGDNPPPEDRLLTNVWVQNSSQRTAAQSVKGTWINLNIGTASTPMVDPDKVGVGYVSPGYL